MDDMFLHRFPEHRHQEAHYCITGDEPYCEVIHEREERRLADLAAAHQMFHAHTHYYENEEEQNCETKAGGDGCTKTDSKKTEETKTKPKTGDDKKWD